MPAMWRSRDKDTHIRCGEAGIEIHTRDAAKQGKDA